MKLISLATIKKTSKKVEKHYKAMWSETNARLAYFAVGDVRYDLDENVVTLEVRYGLESEGGQHISQTIYVPEYVKTARALAYFILGFIDAKEME